MQPWPKEAVDYGSENGRLHGHAHALQQSSSWVWEKKKKGCEISAFRVGAIEEKKRGETFGRWIWLSFYSRKELPVSLLFFFVP